MIFMSPYLNSMLITPYNNIIVELINYVLNITLNRDSNDLKKKKVIDLLR